MKKPIVVPLAIFVCLGFGCLGAMLQAKAFTTWYPLLDKSWTTPSNTALAIGWGVALLSMGLSFGWSNDRDNDKRTYLALFFAKLLLLFLWTLLFYYFRQPVAGLVAGLIFIALAAWYVRSVRKISLFAAYSFLPCMAWVAFMWYLAFCIVVKN